MSRKRSIGMLAAALGLGVTLAFAFQGGQAPPAQSPPGETGAGERLVLAVEGMTCGSCESRIRAALGAEPGVKRVAVDLGSRTVAVEYEPGASDPKALADAVTRAGYPARFLASGSAVPAPVQPATSGRKGCGGPCCPPG